MGLYASTPEAPDYAKANREGVEAQLETLPLQRMVEAAARSGGKYTDPVSGKTYDFGAMPTSLELDVEQARRTAQAGADISRDYERQRLTDLQELLPGFNQLNLEQQRAAYSAALDAAKTGEQQRLDLELAYRPAFTKSNLEAEKQAYLQSLDLGEMGTRRMYDLQSDLLPTINAQQLDAQAEAYRRSDALAAELDPDATGIRAALAKQVQDELALGGKLTEEERYRGAESVRRGQAARGNILGEAALIDEALKLQEMGDTKAQQRKNNALAFLSTGKPTRTMTAAQVVNPLMPQMNAGSYTAAVPNFNATTTNAPAYNQQVTQSNPWQFVNQNAGQDATKFAIDRYSQQIQAAANDPAASMIGSGLGMAASMMM